MSYCRYCGGPIPPNEPVCPYCGQQSPDYVPYEPAPAVPDEGPRDFSLILVSLGTCPRSHADDVLQDIFGYTAAESKTIVRAIPTQIAQYLTMQQAQYIAQALTEYGMQVAVFSGENAVDLSNYATVPVFNSDGSFVSAALSVLRTLTVANRLRKFRRWTLSSLLRSLFRPRYRVVEPPRHVRRVIHTAPAPEPLYRPANYPRIRDDRSPAGGNRGPTGGSRGLGALGFGLVSGNRSTGSGERGPGGIKRNTNAPSGASRPAASKPASGRSTFGGSSFGGGSSVGKSPAKRSTGGSSLGKLGGSSTVRRSGGSSLGKSSSPSFGRSGGSSFGKSGPKGGHGGRR